MCSNLTPAPVELIFKNVFKQSTMWTKNEMFGNSIAAVKYIYYCLLFIFQIKIQNPKTKQTFIDCFYFVTVN
jgi:hypothetical protein